MNRRQSACRQIRITVWIVSMLCALLPGLAGCDLLNTREPEKPSETSSSFVPPTSPNIVIENLTNAVRERNTENYVRCFVDSTFSQFVYSFQAAQSAQNAYGSLFHDWNLTSEQTYFENLRSSVPTGGESTLILTDARFESIQADSAMYTATYTLVIQHTKQDIPQQQAQGTLIFMLSLDRNNNWAIHRWMDYNKTGDNFSWSDFKARFSS
jgi:hypothetical protein